MRLICLPQNGRRIHRSACALFCCWSTFFCFGVLLFWLFLFFFFFFCFDVIGDKAIDSSHFNPGHFVRVEKICCAGGSNAATSRVPKLSGAIISRAHLSKEKRRIRSTRIQPANFGKLPEHAHDSRKCSRVAPTRINSSDVEKIRQPPSCDTTLNAVCTRNGNHGSRRLVERTPFPLFLRQP